MCLFVKEHYQRTVTLSCKQDYFLLWTNKLLVLKKRFVVTEYLLLCLPLHANTRIFVVFSFSLCPKMLFSINVTTVASNGVFAKKSALSYHHNVYNNCSNIILLLFRCFLWSFVTSCILMSSNFLNDTKGLESVENRYGHLLLAFQMNCPVTIVCFFLARECNLNYKQEFFARLTKNAL